MSLKDQLLEDMKSAMKSKDVVTLGVIRFLRSEIKNIEIDKGEQDDEGILSIIARQVKQIKESIEEYKKGDRDDLVEEEIKKLEVLEAYLPQQLSDEELQSIVDEVISEMSGQQMGPIIGAVMKKVSGKADGGRVSAMVKKQLS